ncbi:MAG TPA: vanadium-dependent haloperoxidase [Chitinophagaceae bacterium]|nr:vanadium-dependent haloperoxidase [Chitinophagaceae bacterium]
MRRNFFKAILLLTLVSVYTVACQRDKDKYHDQLKGTKTFDAEVVIRWLNMQLQMVKVPLAAGTGSQATDRAQAYCGIALYEAVVPGMADYRSLAGQLIDFPVMPRVDPDKAYNWALCANAALAEMNRRLFPTTDEAFKTAMTNLENELTAAYNMGSELATVQRSLLFGKEVATRVANWAASDGFANVNPPYIPPVGPGLWIPTAPPPAVAVNAYAYQRRLMVRGSADGTALQPLPPFSTEPGSAFYAMAKEVYDASFVATDDQKAMALYFRDNPGYSPGGGFIWILSEALRTSGVALDKAALAYVKVGLAQHEATIVLNTDKYKFNVIRPVTYIRAVIDPNWQTYIATPNHPEYPSGHATTNGAVLSMMSHSFGENFPITLRTYDYLNFPARSYTTFTAMGKDMADSRFYGGLHFRLTCERSLVQGRKVAQNILNTIQFGKGWDK